MSKHKPLFAHVNIAVLLLDAWCIHSYLDEEIDVNPNFAVTIWAFCNYWFLSSFKPSNTLAFKKWHRGSGEIMLCDEINMNSGRNLFASQIPIIAFISKQLDTPPGYTTYLTLQLQRCSVSLSGPPSLFHKNVCLWGCRGREKLTQIECTSFIFFILIWNRSSPCVLSRPQAVRYHPLLSLESIWFKLDVHHSLWLTHLY